MVVLGWILIVVGAFAAIQGLAMAASDPEPAPWVIEAVFGALMVLGGIPLVRRPKGRRLLDRRDLKS
jgi:uncharacterized membrane protein HdeD (DUF308 family)